jgi:hypothetical protein
MEPENKLENFYKICKEIKYRKPEESIVFYAVNMHGEETNNDFTVPKGIRLVMFCYSGRILNVCPKFDIFNWRNILLNENAVTDYTTFLCTLSQYSTLRDHFCIYEEGDVVKNIVFKSDENFRDGIFKLPILASAYDEERKIAFVSSNEVLDRAVKDYPGAKRVIEDIETTSKGIRQKMYKGNIYSSYKVPLSTTLERVTKEVKMKLDSENKEPVTLLILSCRERKVTSQETIKKTSRVYEELEKIYKKYKTELNK